ncbi:hypothetical protein [Erythrobacter sp. WG]|uniref:hypothetical protein n=1 Tax=Erythrobacter sp. WG TaxID=2985510 RepID=UPI002271B5E1|nr:hypothetical protein [Erythrobacter sp. WG]MCX9146958.1 hypothetical protein [Erythrobacter sp. WG]
MMALIPPVEAQVAAEQRQTHPTLLEWIQRDQAVGRMVDSPERAAAGATLHRDVIAAVKAVRVAEDAKAAAGLKSALCLPAPGTTELDSAEIGKWFYSRPPSEYSGTLDQVIAGFLADRFPCP